MAHRKIDALVLARYGIAQDAIAIDGHLEARDGIRSKDNEGIINVSTPLEELDADEQHGLLELACALVGMDQPLCDKRSTAFTAHYIARMKERNAQLAN